LRISLAGLVIFGVISAIWVQGQSRQTGNPERVKRTAAIRSANSNTGAETNIPPSNLHLGALNNIELSSTLAWMLGGRQQLGWYLYEPLIKRLLKTENGLGSEAFAKALAKWQENRALPSTGVLDIETFYAMISAWQAERLKDRTLVVQELLLTAPPSDFYHPTRPEELRLVERSTYQAYKEMVKAAAADRTLSLERDEDGGLSASEKYLKIISAFRSPAYQEKLRRESPQAGRAGLAINSPHFTGRALDLYVGGDPVETKDSNRAQQIQGRVYQWLVDNAERFGFRPYFYEPWHWEYVGED
jgi:hypothetical protein